MASSNRSILSCQSLGAVLLHSSAMAFAFAAISAGEVGTAVFTESPVEGRDVGSATVEAPDAPSPSMPV